MPASDLAGRVVSVLACSRKLEEVDGKVEEQWEDPDR